MRASTAIARAERVAPEAPASTPSRAGRPETRLMLLCARTELDPGTGASIRRLVANGLDWELVWELADHHGLAPLLHHHLSSIGAAPAGVPWEEFERLARRRDATAHRNLYLTAQLLEILQGLEGKGVPAVALKGSVLAHTLYPDPSLREFSDLDILVRREDLPIAREWLLSREFLTSSLDRSGGQEAAFRRSMHAEVFVRPRDRVNVDLHWDLAPAYRPCGLHATRLWPHLEPVSVGGASLRGLPAEIELILLAVHAGRHTPDPWPRLRWLCDVSEVLRRRPELDWDRVHDIAEAWGCRRLLHLGLRLARDLLEAPLPPTVELRWEADPALAGLVPRIRRRLLEDEREPLGGVFRLRVELRLRERLRDRLASALCQMFVPRRQDWEVIRLPAAFAFLYFPLRLGRLALKPLLIGDRDGQASR